MTLAILCPGQGGQHPAMFDLADEGALALAARAAHLDLRDAAAQPSRTANARAQPLVCAAALATWTALVPSLARADVVPALFAGYSVGELAAHGCSGRLSIADTVALAVRRAAAMDAARAPDDGLVAIAGLNASAIDALAATHGLAIAIENAADRWLLGGRGASLDDAMRDAVARGAQAQRLPVAIASHTPRLDTAATAFRADLRAARWRSPAAPVVAGVDGSLVVDASGAIDTLARQVARTIRWSTCMETLAERGITVALELPPGDALSRMLRERHPAIASRAVEDFRSIDAATAWLRRALEGP